MFEQLSDMGFFTLGAVVKGAFFGLLAAGVVLFAARRLGLFVRHGRVRRFIVALYHLYIPIVFACVGAVWGGTSAAQEKTVAAFDSVRPDIAALSVQAAEGLWTAIMGQAPQGDISIKEVVLVVTREYMEQRFFAPMLQNPAVPEPVRKLAGMAAGGMSQVTLQAVEGQLIESLAGKVSVSPEMLRTVWDKKILQAMRDGLVVDLIALHINTPFRQIESSAKIGGALLMLPVILEMAFAVFTARRRKVSQACAATT